MSRTGVMVLSLLAQEITLQVKPGKLGENEVYCCSGVLGPLPVQNRGTEASLCSSSPRVLVPTVTLQHKNNYNKDIRQRGNDANTTERLE